MGLEIERRFLVAADGWQTHVQTSRQLVQGYLCASENDVTVRIRHDGLRGWLTCKAPAGRASTGAAAISRLEFEYEIPVVDVRCLLNRCRHQLSKQRYDLNLPGQGFWVVDQFSGANEGLLLAEVELADPHAAISLPPWLGEEVSGDGRWSNAALAKRPWNQWSVEEKRQFVAVAS